MSENNNAGTPFLKVQDLAVEYMSNDKVVHAVNVFNGYDDAFQSFVKNKTVK